MLRSVLTCLAAAGLLASAMGDAHAAEKKYTFALVPKNTNNPFFDQALDGCRKAEKELAGAIQCLYIGPGEHGGGDEQAQIVADLISKRVDGIAVSPANAAAIANALAGAKAITDFARENDQKPAIKGGMFDGRVIAPEQVQALATMPSREQMLAELGAGLMAPLANFAGTLNGLLYMMVGALEALRAQKDGGADAAAA